MNTSSEILKCTILWIFKSMKYVTKKNHLVKLVITSTSIFLNIFLPLFSPNNMYLKNFLIYEYCNWGSSPKLLLMPRYTPQKAQILQFLGAILISKYKIYCLIRRQTVRSGLLVIFKYGQIYNDKWFNPFLR